MFELTSLIKSAGYLGLFGIVFAETGLFAGFFLPGDSLLFTAGFLSSQGFLNVVAIILITFVAAVVGDSVGYAFGKKVGPAIFKKPESLLFKPQYLIHAEEFYKKHGKKTIVLARFMPVVRTFAPIVAGAGKMHYPTFLFYNVAGGALWTVSLPLLGYYLGRAIPNIDRYIIPIVLLIILLSVTPPIFHLAKHKIKARS